MSIRDSVIASIELLASASDQLRYEEDVPHAYIPAELIEAGDDIFRPKDAAYSEAFTADELRDLAHLYGLIREAARTEVSSVMDLLKQPAWRRVMAVAKDCSARIGRAV